MRDKRKGVLFLVAFLFSFVLLSARVLDSLDFKISEAIPALWSPFFNSFFIFISQYLFDTKLLCIISVSLFLLLFFRKDRKGSLFFISIVGLTAVCSELLKLVFRHSRPLTSLVVETSNSFPSSHSSVSFVFFLSIFFFFGGRLKYKKLFLFICVFLIGLIGFSRIYLNVHYLSDVLAGYLLGAIVFVVFLLSKDYLSSYLDKIGFK